MLDKALIEDTVAKAIEHTHLFMVEVRIEKDNRIVVEVDADHGNVDIDDCVAISRAVEEALDRDKEDFELEVGSAGITSPLKVLRQYEKNVGNDLEVLTADSRKLRGRLERVGAEGIVLVTTVKEKPEGAKRPVMVEREVELPFSQVRQAVCMIDFK